MTKRMTTEQLEAILKRAGAATEGPWRYNDKWGYLAPVTAQRQISHICNEITRGYDAEFIAEARTDIPALLAEVERLREVMKFYADQRNYVRDSECESTVDIDDGHRAFNALGVIQ